MPKFFFRKKTFLFVIISLRYSGYLTNTSCVCQVAGISKRYNDKQKSFFPKKNPRATIRDFKKSDFLNSNTCFYSQLYGKEVHGSFNNLRKTQ